jgi:hypothetical protein
MNQSADTSNKFLQVTPTTYVQGLNAAYNYNQSSRSGSGNYVSITSSSNTNTNTNYGGGQSYYVPNVRTTFNTISGIGLKNHWP